MTPGSGIVISLFLGGRNTKIKRASLRAAKHGGAAKYGGLHPHRYSYCLDDSRSCLLLSNLKWAKQISAREVQSVVLYRPPLLVTAELMQ